MSFFAEFFDTIEGKKSTAVCCPFPHYTTSGIPYYETNPSAGVDTINYLFHCMCCDAGYNEVQFIEQYFGCNYIDAKKFQNIFNTYEDISEWKANTTLSEESLKKGLGFGFTKEVMQELNIATAPGTEHNLCFPVFMYGHLMDIRTYNPGGKPKVKSRAGSITGLIIPYDIWRESDLRKTTIICAGEKDMANARSRGFNAITLTGGEKALPKTLKQFSERRVIICYDNDEAGKIGANNLALALKPYAKSVKICTGFHEICKEEGEDITDFFVKYGKTKDDLIKYFKDTPEFEPTEHDLKPSYKVMDLLTAARPENVGKMVQSNIQVVAVSDQTFICPALVIAEKFMLSNSPTGDTMRPGDFKDWELKDDNAQDILHLIDNAKFTEETLNKNIKKLIKKPEERCLKIKIIKNKTVFKCYITDMYETTNMEVQPLEFTAYAMNCRLESGKKYLVTHKLVPHPYKGQQLVMVVTDAIQASDSVSNFQLTDENVECLKYFRYLPGNVERKMQKLIEKAKGLIGYNGNNTLIETIDLNFHTPLQFNFGTFKEIRGYLDTIVIGESRTGKSSTADTLRRTYGLGTFTSLAGNSATIPGLVGGSNKTASGFQTRAGIIPQNHRGMLIFEEFGKSNNSVITELTDIRSSNEVRITRVAGTITLPAMVRMLSLTNPKNTGVIKPISSYPNGISIITELVSTAEDIARYDIILVLADKGQSQVDPFWEPEEPFPKEAYQVRIRWVWSRKPEQIIIDKEVGLYILDQANLLNKLYDCHIKFFGTEAWKKLSRLAIAVASYLVSTDDTWENIIVTKEHVDYAVNYYISIYDNSTFKLKEYVEHERKYTTIDNDGIAALQDFFIKHSAIVQQLEQCSSTNRATLTAGAGITNDELSKALNILSTKYFIRFAGQNIIPTERFRLGLAQINKNVSVPELGQIYDDPMPF